MRLPACAATLSSSDPEPHVGSYAVVEATLFGQLLLLIEHLSQRHGIAHRRLVARRIHAGNAQSFPDPPARDAFGLPMAIWA